MDHLRSDVAALPKTEEKLLLGRTLAGAYSIVGRHLPAFLLLSVLLAIASDGCPYLATRFVDEGTSELRYAAISGAAGTAGLILGQLASVIVGVTWFRIILLEEPHRLRSYMRFGRRGLRFLGIDLLLAFLTFLPVIGFAAVAALRGANLEGNASPIESLMIPLTIGAFVWGSWCAAWFGLAYPAVATDACQSGSLRFSWRLSRGHRLRLFLVFLLGSGVWSIVGTAMLVTGVDAAQAWRPIDMVAAVVIAGSTLCNVAVASVAYQQLQGRSFSMVATAFD